MSNDVKPVPRAPVTANALRADGPSCVSAPGTVSAGKRDELCLLINSRNPIITAETNEEQRLSGLLETVAAELGIPLYVWSVTAGLARAGGIALYNSDQPEQALANIATIRVTPSFCSRISGGTARTTASVAVYAISRTDFARPAARL